MTIWKSSSGITARSRRHNHLTLCPERRYDPFHDHLAFDSLLCFQSPCRRQSAADLSSSGASFLPLKVPCSPTYFHSTTVFFPLISRWFHNFSLIWFQKKAPTICSASFPLWNNQVNGTVKYLFPDMYWKFKNQRLNVKNAADFLVNCRKMPIVCSCTDLMCIPAWAASGIAQSGQILIQLSGRLKLSWIRPRPNKQNRHFISCKNKSTQHSISDERGRDNVLFPFELLESLDGVPFSKSVLCPRVLLYCPPATSMATHAAIYLKRQVNIWANVTFFLLTIFERQTFNQTGRISPACLSAVLERGFGWSPREEENWEKKKEESITFGWRFE